MPLFFWNLAMRTVFIYSHFVTKFCLCCHPNHICICLSIMASSRCLAHFTMVTLVLCGKKVGLRIWISQTLIRFWMRCNLLHGSTKSILIFHWSLCYSITFDIIKHSRKVAINLLSCSVSAANAANGFQMKIWSVLITENKNMKKHWFYFDVLVQSFLWFLVGRHLSFWFFFNLNSR